MNPPRQTSSPRGTAVAVAVVGAAVLLALVVWVRLVRSTNWGEQLVLYPDPVEYAAGAQSLAEEGRFVLHLGPFDARPMYAPGFSMFLAPAVAAGVPGDRLWKVSALLGWPAALGAAAAVAWIAFRRRAPTSPMRAVGVGLVALAAGATWVVAPFCSNFAATLLSDEATLLAALAAAAALLVALSTAGRRAARWYFLSGAGWMSVVALRPVSGALLALGGVPLLLWAVRAQGLTELRRALLWALLGATLAALPVVVVLGRSGFPVWRWTAYEFWVPAKLHPGIADFKLAYAWLGNPDRPFGPGQPNIPHAVVAAKTYLGIPGLVPWHYLGYYWPVLGWVTLAVWTVRRLRQRTLEAALARAVGLWIALTTAIFVVYAWPLVRYLIGPQWVVLIVTFAPLAVLAARGDGRRVAAALVAAAAIAGSSWLVYARANASGLPWEDLNGPTRRAAADWLALADGERAGLKMTFDPARAQALGLLGREVRARVGCWGLPIDRYHWVRLKEHGLVHLDELRHAVLSPAAAPFVRRVDACSAPLASAATQVAR